MSKCVENEFGPEWIAELEKIATNVDKWPQWKKEGWAILDKEVYDEKVDLDRGGACTGIAGVVRVA